MIMIKLYFILIIKSLKSSNLTIKLSIINFYTLINISNNLSYLYNKCLLNLILL
jgi:hypothetical protein